MEQMEEENTQNEDPQEYFRVMFPVINLNGNSSDNDVQGKESVSEEAEGSAESSSGVPMDVDDVVNEPAAGVAEAAAAPQPAIDPAAAVLQPAIDPAAAVLQPAIDPAAAVLQPAIDPAAAVPQPAIDPAAAVPQPAIDPAAAAAQPAIDPLKVRKIPKPPKQAFRCLECCITYFSDKQYRSHLEGKRHKRTVRFKENHPVAEQNDNDDGFNLRDGRSCCKFCNVTVTGIRQLKQHLKGRNHKNQKKRIKKIRNDNNSAGFGVFQPRVNLYYCSDCRTSITGEIPYVDHMHGKRHRRAVRIRRMGHF